ncbi:MAG: hypothetical protein PHQ75_08560, partial [Thermoguttaceae bacterium]|nr:hypothetical protein [Thermoguttaceae bacterium]
MTKDKNEQKPSKARRESLSLNLDSGELDLDSTAGSVQDEVKKPKRGRPRKVKTDAEGEKPTKKASRKSAVKSDDCPLSLFGKNDKAGETLDFMIGSLPEEKPSRGRRKKVAPKTKSTAAQPEQTKTVLDPVSSIVSQLDRRVSGETEKPKSASAPAVEVPDLNAPDFSLDDFFASDEQL